MPPSGGSQAADPDVQPPATDLQGLTAAEVQTRVGEGRVNAVPDAPVRSLGEIVRANVFTPINAIIGFLFVVILIFGHPQDSVFAAVIISNSVIGIVQELRARKTLNELALLNAPKARVVRDGEASSIGLSQVVADDLLELQPGFQVVVDGEVVQSSALEVDESLLTGESEPIVKKQGDEVLSGSFVVAGSGYYRATRIGAESYSSRLAEEARQFKLAKSDLREGIDRVLRWQLLIIPPLGLLLLLRLWHSDDVREIAGDERWREAVTGTVAACVSMVPAGLVLLTSVALIAGALALARRRALAKELASVELLARVDTICLDKTGTITTGEIAFGGVEPVDGNGSDFVAQALGAMGAADANPNPTLAAIAAKYESPGWTLEQSTPFSSARKWAGARFAEHGSFYLGAPDILLEEDDTATRAIVTKHAEQGSRVLLLARSDDPYEPEALPRSRRPVALVLLEDEIRPDAPEILAFFREQGVRLVVISGDHPRTVAAVAQRAGVPGAEQGGYDARDLPSDPDELAEVLEDHSVFGRVTPHQKRAMVGALQAREHVVAMTGDGVNDVLALKDADMGIAMGAGSAASRAVAQLVLLDNAYATLPRVLSEGRRVINNIERVANLFITKSAYAVILTALVVVSGLPYPFLPRHFTLIDWFSIGIPGFFLALAPNNRLVRPHFLERVLRFSIPAGVSAATATFVVFALARADDDMSLIQSRTVATITLLTAGLTILVLVSRPLATWKLMLAVAMGGFYAVVLAIPTLREFFELDLPPASFVPILVAGAAAGAVGIVLLPRLLPWGREPD
jgi:cation-transporting ATPase E